MCLGKDAVGGLLRFHGNELKSSELETVLEIEIYDKLNLENEIKNLCLKNLVLCKESQIFYTRKIKLSYVKEESSIQFNNKISFQLLVTCFDV